MTYMSYTPYTTSKKSPNCPLYLQQKSNAGAVLHHAVFTKPVSIWLAPEVHPVHLRSRE